ncbi:MAG: AAA family ATPase [bacterium]
MVKEISLGLGISLLIIFFLQGFNVIPLIFLGFLAFFMWKILKQNLGSGLNTNTKKDNKKIPRVSFEEIGGQNSAIKELKEGLNFIKNTFNIKKMGIRPIKGLLLSGPPGTGKTMMAKAAARYTDSVFVGTSGSEFIEMYAGVGAKRIRELFEDARNKAIKNKKNSAIVFIDEIDILGGKRGQVTSHLEYDQTLNQLLTEMDGLSLDDSIQILVMATTNRKDILDPALLRPGRFDRIVRVDLPAKKGRLDILKIHTQNKPLADDVDLEQIARETFRFSGAHLENLSNEAAIFALRDNKEKIHQKHFLEAIDKVIMGEKLDRRPNQKELKRIAIHETGHALLSEIMAPGSVSAITITSRGKALGYVRHNPEDDFYLQTEDYLEQNICISIAGAVAEDILLESRSTGATGDFDKAIKLAKKMITSGMTDLGVVKIDSIPKNILHEELSKIMKNYEKKVKKIIKSNQNIINKISEKLIENESYSGEDLRKLLDINVEEKAEETV